MTTREVAEYLRVKERKIYELVREREIPCTRVSGKWLFPKRLIDVWLLEGAEGPRPAAQSPPPAIIAGSQDPLLDWAVQESGSDLALLACGSAGGLDRLADGRALAAALHLRDHETGEYNVAAIEAVLASREVVAVTWAWREQGLVVAPGNPLGLGGIADLAAKGARVSPICRSPTRRRRARRISASRCSTVAPMPDSRWRRWRADSSSISCR